MTLTVSSSTVLNNGVKMPWLGLGVFKAKNDGEVESAIRTAVQAGYRSIDTASLYANEEGVGRGIKECGVPRDELFITTKVWNSEQGYDSTLEAFERSRKKLDLDVIDLYLVHWPVKSKYKETWRALEKLYKDGAVRAIGVSNFQIHHLKDIMGDFEIVPAVNQVECHPILNQSELLGFCRDHGIQLEAWGPLMQGKTTLDREPLQTLAAKYGKTPAQVVLRWHLQRGVVIIPKSVHDDRIRENAGLYDFELTVNDMAAIDGMNESRRFGDDPDNFNF